MPSFVTFRRPQERRSPTGPWMTPAYGFPGRQWPARGEQENKGLAKEERRRMSPFYMEGDSRLDSVSLTLSPG